MREGKAESRYDGEDNNSTAGGQHIRLYEEKKGIKHLI